jgi:hypothetical protein
MKNVEGGNTGRRFLRPAGKSQPSVQPPAEQRSARYSGILAGDKQKGRFTRPIGQSRPPATAPGLVYKPGMTAVDKNLRF